MAVEYQRELARLYDQVGDQDRSLACIARVMELGGGIDSIEVQCPDTVSSLTQPPRENRQTNQGAVAAGWGRGGAQAVFDRIRGRRPPVRLLLALGTLALVVAVWFLPAPSDLSPSGMRVLASLAALIVLGLLNVLPNYLLGLLMIAGWAATGTLPIGVAASGFASATWFLLLASMAIGAAVARSGLLYRGAVELVRRLPASHRVRCLTLGGLGVLLAPGMPNPAGRLLLAAPLAQDISETLRHPDRSPGSAGLALSTFIGFGMMSPLFLTGSSIGLLGYGLLPSETRAEIDWVTWFLAALPACLVLFGLTMAFVLTRYRPNGADDLPEETLALQKRVLGPLTRDERTSLTVLVSLLVGFSTQSLHGIEPAWLAIAAVALLFLLGALDNTMVEHGVNVDFLLYLGVLLGFGPIFAHVGLDHWLAEQLSAVTGLIDGSAIRCLMVVAVISAVAGIAFRPSPIVLLLGVALFPTASSVGVDPWVVMFTVMLSNNLWLYPQQNVLYQAAYHATGERSFTHAQARPLALIYPAFVLVAILASVPYWRWLGLVA